MSSKGARPKKALGQHFLSDPTIAGKLVEATGAAPGMLVVELGAGRGFLTRPMVGRGASVVAVEIDVELSRDLADSFSSQGGEHKGQGEGQVEVVNADFTRISLTTLVTTRGYVRCRLVGNIPYRFTRHVLFSFLVDEIEVIEAAYLMLQKEVGERIIAAPGSRTYGVTSVILQSLYRVRPVMRLPGGSFHPRPQVDSVFLEFLPLADPVVSTDEIKTFSRFVRNVFQQRRKKIQNSIRASYSLSEEKIRKVQAATAIDLERRPEALSKEELVALSRTLEEVQRVER